MKCECDTYCLRHLLRCPCHLEVLRTEVTVSPPQGFSLKVSAETSDSWSAPQHPVKLLSGSEQPWINKVTSALHATTNRLEAEGQKQDLGGGQFSSKHNPSSLHLDPSPSSEIFKTSSLSPETCVKTANSAGITHTNTQTQPSLRKHHQHHRRREQRPVPGDGAVSRIILQGAVRGLTRRLRPGGFNHSSGIMAEAFIVISL